MCSAAPFAIRKTSVSREAAKRVKSGTPSLVCAVSTVKPRARARWVTGIPKRSAAATAEVTPGTISQRTPACKSAESSSPPRPNTKGSPPLRRTVSGYFCAHSASSAQISSCARLCAPARLPT